MSAELKCGENFVFAVSGDFYSSTSFGYLLPTRGLVLKGGKPDFGTILHLAQNAESAGFDWAVGRR